MHHVPGRSTTTHGQLLVVSETSRKCGFADRRRYGRDKISQPILYSIVLCSILKRGPVTLLGSIIEVGTSTSFMLLHTKIIKLPKLGRIGEGRHC